MSYNHPMKPESQQLPGMEWIEAVAVPVFLLERGVIQFANPAAADLAGQEFEALKGSDVRTLLRLDETALAEITPLLLGQRGSGEYLAGIETATGREVPVRLVFQLVVASQAVQAGSRRLAQETGRGALVMLTVISLSETDRPLREVVDIWRDLREHDLLMAENMRQKDLLQKVFEVDPGGLAVISGPDLIVRVVNPTYRSLLPDPAINPIGRPFQHLWAGPNVEEEVEFLRTTIESGQSSDLNGYQPVWLAESNRTFNVRVHPLPWEDEAGVLIVMWETTALDQARRTADQLAQESQRRAAELSAVIDSLPDGVLILDANGLILNANPAARGMLGFDPLGVPKAELFEHVRIEDLDGRAMRLEDMPYTRAMQGQVVHGDRFVLAKPESGKLHVLASSSPLSIDSQVVGVVSVWSDITELAQRRQELEALVNVASSLRNAIIQDEMYPIILEQVLHLLHMQGASLITLDQATNELVVRLGVGEWAPVTGQRIEQGEGISSRVMSSGEAFLSNDIQREPDLVRAIFTGNLSCGACVPLSSHGLAFGAIWMGRSTPISEGEVALLTAIADIASSNINRARLFEQTQLRFQRLSALHSIDMAITSSLDLNLTLSVLLDQVVSQMRVDAADILLFDPAMHWLEFASGRGFLHPQSRMERHRLSDSPAGQVAMERRVVSIPDLDRHEIPRSSWLSPAENFRAYFAAPLIAKGQVKGVLELFLREPHLPDAEWLEFLDTLATQAAIAIDGAELFERLQRTNEELTVAYDATIEGWSHALELRDHETHGHAQRVTELTIRLARRMGVREEEIPHYRRGVLLHDIGKMAVPDSILLKEGPLTTEEQEIMRRHPRYAYEMLSPIAYLRPALEIPYCHHEWWDGSGYPRGLKGEEIPFSARIFAVVDVWDALCSDRNYRQAWPTRRVIDHIQSMSGTHFDPRVVDEFLKMVQSTDRSRYSRF